MNKLILIFMFSALIISCKNQEEKEEKDYPTYSGDFIYTDGAAVIEGNNYVYGVEINEKAKELADKTKKIQREPFDMVNVTVKGELNKNESGKEGWQEILTIKEIIKVSDKPSEADIKLEEKKE